MLHDRQRNYAGSHCEGTRRFIVTEKLDTQADAGRGPQRGRFAKTTSGRCENQPNVSKRDRSTSPRGNSRRFRRHHRDDDEEEDSADEEAGSTHRDEN